MHYSTIYTQEFLPAINFTDQSLTNMRTFSAICFSFNSLNNLLAAATFFSIFLSQIIYDMLSNRYPSSTDIP